MGRPWLGALLALVLPLAASRTAGAQTQPPQPTTATGTAAPPNMPPTPSAAPPGTLLPTFPAAQPVMPAPMASTRPPGMTPLPEGAQDRYLPANRARLPGPLRFIPLPRGLATRPPGEPSRVGRPRPGSALDPGATGPGISQGEENFLDGALDPRTGWPFVLLDHFTPRPERVERFWVVNTRDCPQQMGTDPWQCLKVRHFDSRGELVEEDPSVMLSQAAGVPVLIQVQGSLTTPDVALGGLMWTHSWLEHNRALLPETVIIAFDWPSQRVYRRDVRDINEKGRRAFVAAYHLARFVQGFPADSRICLLGQSYGGRVVPSALHLLGGGCLNSQDHDPFVRLPTLRPDLHLHGVILSGASDHTWLDPGARLDHALIGCEAFLNLYNRRDEALRFYPLLIRSDHHQALGKLGLKNSDFARLGPAAARYAEHDVDDLLGREHTLLDAVANRKISRWIAPYLWAPDPGPSPPHSELDSVQPVSRSGSRARGGRPRAGGTAN
jgi:hypothetical protein